jgi:hypothetical protein
MKPIALEDIPMIFPTQDMRERDVLNLALPALVDDRPARIFIMGESPEVFMGDEKIVIIWDSKHEVWPDGFMTKYYQMVEPGKLGWGHEGEVFYLNRFGHSINCPRDQ